MKIKFPFLLSILAYFILTLFTSCNGGEMKETLNPFPSIKVIPVSSWEKLSQKKIYFGHQSVGYNIIDGIKDIMKQNPQIRLNIFETSDPTHFDEGIFAHSRVGKNEDPKSKTESFDEFMRKGIGDSMDISFFKFCYVDIQKNTDKEDLFEDYKSKLSLLEKNYPRVMFIHVTIPLRTVKIGWKTRIKEWIGKGEMWEYAGNIERNEYNSLIREEYEERKPFFDLAKIESTYPDGKRSSFTANGKLIYSLIPEYTKDGGHLNERGRKIVAEQLLILLANLSK